MAQIVQGAIRDDISGLQPAPIVRYPSQSSVCEPVASGDAIVGVTESRYRRAEVLKPLLVGYVPDDQEVVGKGSRILSADGLPPKGDRLVVGENTTVYL